MLMFCSSIGQFDPECISFDTPFLESIYCQDLDSFASADPLTSAAYGTKMFWNNPSTVLVALNAVVGL